MKDVALAGLPFSGKSTIFNAVARAHAATGGGAQKANIAVVTVPDGCVDELARLHDSKKRTYAQVRLIDVPGLEARSLGDARASDALAVVLAAFGDNDPAAQLERFRSELIVADLQTMEKVLERVRKQSRVGADPKAKEELEVYERAEAVLSDGRWLAEEPWEPDALRTIGLVTPLTVKPALHVVNVDEAHGGAVPDGLTSPAIVIRGLLEAEAADLDPDDAAALLAEFGVTESATARFVRAVYALLDLVTFYTAGETEARAWEVPRGSRAPQAAGAVHTDMERGFIRCETVSYDDLVAAGSWDAAVKAGKMRVEGKDYEIRDADVVHIRHSS